LIHPMALLVGPTGGVVLCMEVGILLRYLFAMWDQDPSGAIGAGLGILLVTGSVCALCLWIGPGLLTRLLTSEKRPA
jgi:hypothetical protein